MPQNANKEKSLAGAAVVDVSPKSLNRGRIWMSGYKPNRFALEQADPVAARALAFGDRKNGFLIVSVDTCLISPLQASNWAREIKLRTGLPQERILIAATHTHSGPDLSWFFGGIPFNYFARIRNGTIKAAVSAWNSREPARLFWGCGAHELGIPRRSGLGETARDNEFVVLQFRTGNKVVATLVNLGCHGVVLPRNSRLLSSDLPGMICRIVDRTQGGVTLFVPRVQGDVNPDIPGEDAYNQQGSYSDLERLGKTAGELIGKACAESSPAPAEPIRVKTGEINVEIKNMMMHLMMAPWWTGKFRKNFKRVNIPLRKFQIGEIQGVSVPGEVLTDLGLQLLHGMKQPAFFFSYCGGYYGYLMTNESFKLGGYEPSVSPGPVASEEILKVIKSLSKNSFFF